MLRRIIALVILIFVFYSSQPIKADYDLEKEGLRADINSIRDVCGIFTDVLYETDYGSYEATESRLREIMKPIKKTKMREYAIIMILTAEGDLGIYTERTIDQSREYEEFMELIERMLDMFGHNRENGVGNEENLRAILNLYKRHIELSTIQNQEVPDKTVQNCRFSAESFEKDVEFFGVFIRKEPGYNKCIIDMVVEETASAKVINNNPVVGKKNDVWIELEFKDYASSNLRKGWAPLKQIKPDKRYYLLKDEEEICKRDLERDMQVANVMKKYLDDIFRLTDDEETVWAVAATIFVESGGDPELNSPMGALGLGQFTAETASRYDLCDGYYKIRISREDKTITQDSRKYNCDKAEDRKAAAKFKIGKNEVCDLLEKKKYSKNYLRTGEITICKGEDKRTDPKLTIQAIIEHREWLINYIEGGKEYCKNHPQGGNPDLDFLNDVGYNWGQYNICKAIVSTAEKTGNKKPSWILIKKNYKIPTETRCYPYYASFFKEELKNKLA